MLKYTAIAIVVLIGAAFAYVRLMPVSAERFHVDPETTERPSVRGHILVRDGADIAPVKMQVSRADLAQEIEKIILATPRTVKLSGDIYEGYASYVTRSGLWGFPDIASVKVIDNADGTSAVLVLSRQIYGIEDLGVNEARVKDWLGQL